MHDHSVPVEDLVREKGVLIRESVAVIVVKKPEHQQQQQHPPLRWRNREPPDAHAHWLGCETKTSDMEEQFGVLWT